MSGNQRQGDDNTGWGCFGALLVLGVLAAAFISAGAIVDPFDWAPTVAEVWSDCEDGSDDGSCDWDEAYPGFWAHITLNVVFAAAAAFALIFFLAAVSDHRERRRSRFDDAEAAAAYAATRRWMGAATVGLGIIAALPMAVLVR